MSRVVCCHAAALQEKRYARQWIQTEDSQRVVVGGRGVRPLNRAFGLRARGNKQLVAAAVDRRNLVGIGTHVCGLIASRFLVQRGHALDLGLRQRARVGPGRRAEHCVAIGAQEWKAVHPLRLRVAHTHAINPRIHGLQPPQAAAPRVIRAQLGASRGGRVRIARRCAAAEQDGGDASDERAAPVRVSPQHWSMRSTRRRRRATAASGRRDVRAAPAWVRSGCRHKVRTHAQYYA